MSTQSPISLGVFGPHGACEGGLGWVGGSTVTLRH